MYKKILWWIKNHPEKPLSYSLLVAAIFAEKCDPEPFFKYVKNGFKLDQFIEDCKKSNQFTSNKIGVEAAFKEETGIEFWHLIQSEIWQEIITKDSVIDYIAEKTFNSQDEIRTLCEKIYSDYLNENIFMQDTKTIMKIYGQRGVVFSTQMKNLGRAVGNREKWIDGTSNQYWFGYNAIRCITNRLHELLKCEQTEEGYFKAAYRLKDYFNFSNLQIEMLKYFFCQSIEGTCPPHKNKAIYIWGDSKDAGKTTIASTIVCILNGEKNIENVRLYKSNLPQELSFKEHVAPMICSCRAVLMDEVNFKEGKKAYGTFKDRITTDGAKIRFVFQNQIDVQAKANYVFSSNDPIDEFVIDKTERRLFEFHIEKKYKQLTYELIYDAFLDFARQCKRDRDWVEWYDSMSSDTEVKGLESKNIDDIKTFFEMDGFEAIIKDGAAQVSIGTFYEWVQKFDKTASKKLIRECIILMFGEELKKSTWRKLDILKVLSEIKEETRILIEHKNETDFQTDSKKIMDAEDIEMNFNDKCPF